MNYDWALIRMILYLLFVICLIYLISIPLKKRMVAEKRSRYISILERYYFSPKVSLVLVRVNNKVFLIGLKESGMELIAEWESQEFEDLTTTNKGNFREYMQAFMSKRDYEVTDKIQDNPDGMQNRRDDNDLS